MSYDIERLYALLPAFHRIRDIELGKTLVTPAIRDKIRQLQILLDSLADPDSQDAMQLRQLIDEQQRGPVKALLSVIAEQIAVLEENLDQLYDDQFIETCAEWVVPYIGDLVGTRSLLTVTNGNFSQRAEVANTIGYRRRKGTASVLQRLARDVTGDNAVVVEFFQLLATTQYMNHLRPQNKSFISLRNHETLYYLNTPFDTIAHTADVRSIEKQRGKYNIPNVGIFVYRIKSYPLVEAPGYKVDDRRYRFDALGRDLPLYNETLPEDDRKGPATPLNVATPIGCRILHDHLTDYYGEGKSLVVYLDDALVPATDICVCDLSDWMDSGGDVVGWSHMPNNKVAIDPVSGRLAFPSSKPAPAKVAISYWYGFSAEMGGGGYGREESFSTDLINIIRVPAEKATIAEALQAIAGTGGIVEIQNNDYYFETPVFQVKAGTKIELRAAEKCRPVLVLDGECVIAGGDNSELSLNGLLISGGYMHIPEVGPDGQANTLFSLELQHCTLAPGPTAAIGSVAAQPDLPRLVVQCPDVRVILNLCITGSIRAADTSIFRITGCIVDAGDEMAVAFAGLTGQDPGAAWTINKSTVIGKVYTLQSDASDTIFMSGTSDGDSWPGPVLAERLQQGCTRFSYVPPGSKLPRPYHCQPQLAGGKFVAPVFTSLRYGDAGYCQLSRICPCEVSSGADDGSEMGVFHDLYLPQRLANLRSRLDEYLRFGLEAGIFLTS